MYGSGRENGRTAFLAIESQLDSSCSLVFGEKNPFVH